MLAPDERAIYNHGMRRLPLGPIEAFVAVARSGSLAKAAVVMNLSVPALSRRIQLLEAQLGVELFERAPRGLTPTAAGTAYFKALDPAWDSIATATEAVRRQGRRTTIRVSVMPTFAANWLMPRLGRFQERYGGVEIELHTTADIEDLQTRPDLDCAIRLGRGPWPGLHCEALLPVHAFPVASPSFLDSTRPPRQARDLISRTLIGSHHQPEFWREWFAGVNAGAGAEAEAGPEHYRSYDNLQVVYEAAAAGLGIALGLDPVVRPYIDSGRLMRIFPDHVPLPRRFHLVRRREATPSRTFTLFREWLFREAEAFNAGTASAV